MRFFQISVVILEFFFDYEPAFFIEPLSPFIDNVHVKVDSFYFRMFFDDILFYIFHHLSTNIELAIGFQNAKGQNIGMGLFPELFETDSVRSDHDIVVEGELGQFGIFKDHFDVERCAVFDWEGFEIEFSEYVDVLAVDIAVGDFEGLFGGFHVLLF